MSDQITRRVEDVKKLFGLAERDWLLFFLFVSVGFNIYQSYNTGELQKEWKDEIVKELRRDAVPSAVEDAVRPMREGVERANEKLDTFLNKNKR